MDDTLENKSEEESKKTMNDDEYEEIESDDDSSESSSNYGNSGRRRVKIKKRIRVKKKTSTKRKYKKVIERIIWIVFIAVFVTALYILFNQLGITDEKYKATRKRSDLLPLQHNANGLAFTLCSNKQNLLTTV